MDSTYGEFQGTDLDPSADWDYDDEFEDEGNDLLPILGASAALAAVVGGIMVLAGTRRNPTPEERIQDAIAHIDKSSRKVAGQLEKRGTKGMAALDRQRREVVAEIEKRGKKGLRALEKAAGDGNLRDLLDDAIIYSRKRAEEAGQALEELKLSEMLEEARSRARKAASRIDVQDTGTDVSKRVQKGVQQGMKKARRQWRDLVASEAVEGVLERARKTAERIDVGDIAHEAQKRAGDVVENVRSTDIDAKGALDTLREKVVEVVETVREDLAPKAVDTAQSTVERVREEVIPAAQERVSRLVEETELDEKAARAAQTARKSAESARKGSESLSEILRGLAAAAVTKLVDDILPEARKAGNRAVESARGDVIPAVTDTAGEVAQKLKEDVFPRVGEVAEKTPDVVGDLLKMARERVDELIEHAQPVAENAVEFGKHRAEDIAEFGKHRAGDIAEFGKHRADDVAGTLRGSRNGLSGAVSGVKHGVKDTAASVGGGITGGISSAGKGVKGAVGGAVDKTTRTTKELGSILFWLAALGGLILLVFVPDRDKQQEMWNGVRQFLGEVREMWRDLQGEDYELDAPETGSTE